MKRSGLTGGYSRPLASPAAAESPIRSVIRTRMSEPGSDAVDSPSHAPLVAGVLLEQNGKYLLLQHKFPPNAYGLWGWPAGQVEEGHSLEATAIREAKEETNFDVRLLINLGIYQSGPQDAIKHLYAAEIIGGQLSIDAIEIMNAKWLTEEEIRELERDRKLRSPWVLDGIEAFREQAGTAGLGA